MPQISILAHPTQTLALDLQEHIITKLTWIGDDTVFQHQSLTTSSNASSRL